LAENKAYGQAFLKRERNFQLHKERICTAYNWLTSESSGGPLSEGKEISGLQRQKISWLDFSVVKN
jgi:hypothetical protein